MLLQVHLYLLHSASQKLFAGQTESSHGSSSPQFCVTPTTVEGYVSVERLGTLIICVFTLTLCTQPLKGAGPPPSLIISKDKAVGWGTLLWTRPLSMVIEVWGVRDKETLCHLPSLIYPSALRTTESACLRRNTTLPCCSWMRKMKRGGRERKYVGGGGGEGGGGNVSRGVVVDRSLNDCWCTYLKKTLLA